MIIYGVHEVKFGLPYFALTWIITNKALHVIQCLSKDTHYSMLVKKK